MARTPGAKVHRPGSFARSCGAQLAPALLNMYSTTVSTGRQDPQAQLHAWLPPKCGRKTHSLTALTPTGAAFDADTRNSHGAVLTWIDRLFIASKSSWKGQGAGEGCA